MNATQTKELKMNNYYDDLGKLQNTVVNTHCDIMTFTGFMDDAEKVQHIIRYAKLVLKSKKDHTSHDSAKEILARWSV